MSCMKERPPYLEKPHLRAEASPCPRGTLSEEGRTQPSPESGSLVGCLGTGQRRKSAPTLSQRGGLQELSPKQLLSPPLPSWHISCSPLPRTSAPRSCCQDQALRQL